MSEGDRVSGRKTGKAPERSNFAQACTLLSQFVKEKRNLGNTETKEKTELVLASVKTMNFLTSIEGQAGTSLTALNGVVTTPSIDLRTKTTIQAVKQDFSPQMTIFYSGQVMVFNDLPAGKAEHIISLARKGSVSSNPDVVETIDLTKMPSTPPPPEELPPKNVDNVSIDINKSNGQDDSTSIDCLVVKSSINETLPQRPTQPVVGSDLPIARRNSLHRFLEKRKDRVVAKAPYQVSNRAAMGPPKPDEGSSRGGECSEKQLELKL